MTKKEESEGRQDLISPLMYPSRTPSTEAIDTEEGVEKHNISHRKLCKERDEQHQ